MSLLVYQDGDNICINQNLIPENLRSHLPLLLAELSKSFPTETLKLSMVPNLNDAVAKWVQKYRHNPPNTGGQIRMPELKKKEKSPEPTPEPTGGYVVEVRFFNDGKTQLKRYSCMGFIDLDEALAYVEEHPDIKLLEEKRIKGFPDEGMKAGDKRRTYIVKGEVSNVEHS